MKNAKSNEQKPQELFTIACDWLPLVGWIPPNPGFR